MAREIIPDGYPSELKSTELVRLIEKYALKATNASGNPGYSLGPNYWREMAELGLSELQNRNSGLLNDSIHALQEEIKVLRASNNRSARLTKLLTGISILLASATIYLAYETVNYAKSDYKSDEAWKKDQIEVLKSIEQGVSELNTETAAIPVETDSSASADSVVTAEPSK